MPVPREALMQAQTRINALALVHRILNELEDQSTLDLKQLLEELSRQIAEGMGDTEHVRIEVDVPHMVVASGIAVALALFTVEALTNIFKHAYPLQAQRRDPGQPGAGRRRTAASLSIADDGIGFSMDETGKERRLAPDPHLRRPAGRGLVGAFGSGHRARSWNWCSPIRR